MVKKHITVNRGIRKNNSTEGETIETKMRRLVENQEKAEGQVPLIYTERKEGVLPSYNIKSDRFDAAIEASDKIAKSITAKREERAKMTVVKNDEEIGGDESIQATN